MMPRLGDQPTAQSLVRATLPEHPKHEQFVSAQGAKMPLAWAL